MNLKETLIINLKGELKRWSDTLRKLDDETASDRLPGEELSIKDKVAHLHAWQQISIARLEAAIQNHDPYSPAWLKGMDPDSEDNIDVYNDRIYLYYRDHSWLEVFHLWLSGFIQFITLAEMISLEDYLEVDKFPWLKGYALIAVVEGSLEHHREHFELLL